MKLVFLQLKLFGPLPTMAPSTAIDAAIQRRMTERRVVRTRKGVALVISSISITNLRLMGFFQELIYLE